MTYIYEIYSSAVIYIEETKFDSYEKKINIILTIRINRH